jgi:hypothetical protein
MKPKDKQQPPAPRTKERVGIFMCNIMREWREHPEQFPDILDFPAEPKDDLDERLDRVIEEARQREADRSLKEGSRPSPNPTGKKPDA